MPKETQTIPAPLPSSPQEDDKARREKIRQALAAFKAFDPDDLALILADKYQKKLEKDIKDAAKSLSINEARYVVSSYYQQQEYRKCAYNQVRALEAAGKPASAILFLAQSAERNEKLLKGVLDKFTDSLLIGKWAKSVTGIGPVIAAGLIAHIDISKCQTAGQIHSFAGLDPSKKWLKGQKRPFNADLKKLCFLIGESFIKVSNNENDVYGHVYRARKDYEQKKNENGEYADQAAQILASKNIGKDTEAFKWYSKGMLPPAHINSRARRYAVKLFLSHFFSVWYELHFGEKPPLPYPIAIMGHAHLVPPPNWPMPAA